MKTNTLRQSNRSVGKFGAATSSKGGFGGQSMKSGSVRDKKEDSFDLEDFDEIMEKINLDKTVAEKKRDVKQIKKAAN